MGHTDNFIFSSFIPALKPYMQSLPKGSSIAWLGQQAPRLGVNTYLHDTLLSYTQGEMDNHYYDIKNLEGNPRSHRWDANSDWSTSIANFDLVLGIRILYACNSASQVVSNLRYTVENNKKVIFDFMSGNSNTFEASSCIIDDTELFTKRTSAIIPFFPKAYKESGILSMAGTYKFDVKANHDDQIITLENINENKINFKNILGVRDPVKKRIYILTELNGRQ